jgi:hypothetical protein
MEIQTHLVYAITMNTRTQKRRHCVLTGPTREQALERSDNDIRSRRLVTMNAIYIIVTMSWNACSLYQDSRK